MRTDPWDTEFVDISGSRGLLGQESGRTSATVVLAPYRSAQFRDGIEYVAIDPAGVCVCAARTPDLLPNAVLVFDLFHFAVKAHAAVTKVQHGVTCDQQSQRGRTIEPEWGRPTDGNCCAAWNVCPTEVCSDVERSRPPGSQCADHVGVNREGRAADVAVHCARWWDRHRTSRRLQRFFAWCIDSQIPVLIVLVKMVDPRWPEINAFITTGTLNAKTEGYTRLV